MSAKAAIFGCSRVLLVPGPMIYPGPPFRRILLPIPITFPSGSFWSGLISPHPLTETSLYGPASPRHREDSMHGSGIPVDQGLVIHESTPGGYQAGKIDIGTCYRPGDVASGRLNSDIYLLSLHQVPEEMAPAIGLTCPGCPEDHQVDRAHPLIRQGPGIAGTR